jgi:hypothetical protein
MFERSSHVYKGLWEISFVNDGDSI